MSWFEFDFGSFAISFLSILFEALPFLLLGTLLSGVIDAFLPAGLFEKFNPRKPTPGILLAALLPLILPMCECGVVPVVRRLIRKGVPPACAVAYMLSAPIVNPVVALSTYAAFSGGFSGAGGAGLLLYDGPAPELMTGLRLFLGFLVAILTASIALQFRPESYLVASALPQVTKRVGVMIDRSPDADLDSIPVQGFAGRIAAAIRAASSDFLDVSMYLVVGAAISAVFNTAVNQDVIAPLAGSAFSAVASMMGLSFLLALCSTSDAFVAATFVIFPAAARLAFLVFGPVADIKLLFLYSLLFRRKTIILFIPGVFLLVGALCVRLVEILK